MLISNSAHAELYGMTCYPERGKSYDVDLDTITTSITVSHGNTNIVAIYFQGKITYKKQFPDKIFVLTISQDKSFLISSAFGTVDFSDKPGFDGIFFTKNVKGEEKTDYCKHFVCENVYGECIKPD